MGAWIFVDLQVFRYAMLGCWGAMNVETSAGLSDAGMIAVALTPNLKIAAVCTSYMVSIFHLFAGFVMTQPDMPGWW